MVRLNFSKLLDEVGVINWQSTETRQGLCRFVVLPFFDEEPRRFGQNKHTGDQDDSLAFEVNAVTFHRNLSGTNPCKLHSYWDAVRPSIISRLGSIQNDSSQEETNRDRPLITADNGTSDPLRRCFRLIKWDRCAQEPNL